MEQRKFNLDDYETVEVRIEKFWAKYPEGRIATELVSHENGEFIFVAQLYISRDTEALPIANGYAQEIIGQGMVNKTSALENCETSAIGRALANAGFATKGKRPSREEMQKVARSQEPPKPKLTPQEEEKALSDAFELVAGATSADELKAIWGANSHLIDKEFQHTTLRQYVLQRKDEIEAEANNIIEKKSKK